MSRRELREILHHYDEYVSCCTNPLPGSQFQISCKHFCIRREGACKHLRKRGENEAVLARSGIFVSWKCANSIHLLRKEYDPE
jgi:hypothetical protein